MKMNGRTKRQHVLWSTVETCWDTRNVALERAGLCDRNHGNFDPTLLPGLACGCRRLTLSRLLRSMFFFRMGLDSVRYFAIERGASKEEAESKFVLFEFVRKTIRCTCMTPTQFVNRFRNRTLQTHTVSYGSTRLRLRSAHDEGKPVHGGCTILHSIAVSGFWRFLFKVKS